MQIQVSHPVGEVVEIMVMRKVGRQNDHEHGTPDLVMDTKTMPLLLFQLRKRNPGSEIICGGLGIKQSLHE